MKIHWRLENQMEETLMAKIDLENDLTLKLYDASRQIAGDRWQIVMYARIRIALDSLPRLTEICGAAQAESIRNALGPIAMFEKKRERNFIADDQKKIVLKNMQKLFLDVAAPYLSNPRFAYNYVCRTYQNLPKRY